MNTSKIAYLAIVLLLPTPVLAANQAFSCASLEQLDKNSEDCNDNPHYTKAGQDCLKKLEKLISRAIGTSAAHLRKSAEEAKGNFKASPDDAEKILAAAKIAKEHVSSYRDNIFYPEDWDAPKELIGDPIDFFDSQECYANARDSLEKTENAINHYIDEFGRN